jgi:hypothetical protein
MNKDDVTQDLLFDDIEYEYIDLDNEEEELIPDLPEQAAIRRDSQEEIVEKFVDGQLRIVRTTMDFSLFNLH